jgi:hypothetical protein
MHDSTTGGEDDAVAQCATAGADAGEGMSGVGSDAASEDSSMSSMDMLDEIDGGVFRHMEELARSTGDPESRFQSPPAEMPSELPNMLPISSSSSRSGLERSDMGCDTTAAVVPRSCVWVGKTMN